MKKSIIGLIIFFVITCPALWWALNEFGLNNNLEKIEIAYITIVLFLFVVAMIIRAFDKSPKYDKMKRIYGDKLNDVDEAFDLLDSKLRKEHVLYKTGFEYPNDIEKRLNKKDYRDKDMRRLVELVMYKVGLPTSTMKDVRIVWQKKSKIGESVAGERISRGDSHNEIVLYLKYYYDKYVVLSIIAHEVAHCFLDHHKIKFDDEEKNELLTDTCAMCLGFEDIMSKGYQEFSPNERSIEKIGYLKNYEIKRVLYRINLVKEEYSTVLKGKNDIKRINEMFIENQKKVEEFSKNTNDYKINKKAALLIKEFIEHQAEYDIDAKFIKNYLTEDKLIKKHRKQINESLERMEKYYICFNKVKKKKSK